MAAGIRPRQLKAVAFIAFCAKRSVPALARATFQAKLPKAMLLPSIPTRSFDGRAVETPVVGKHLVMMAKFCVVLWQINKQFRCLFQNLRVGFEYA
ncbi:MAG: hypothetical protein J0I79_33015 [Mesorhizobium sp.]|uniref:hypothetical protein n=1 Tax=Mesorhizobium sp. TaxID=1871066 RepID=UPI001AC0D1C4|nr:hypothetical protein [Mesorhizobium sp.]MBN9222778.1 hypothetical protein [Mesorhizobium sp.]